MAKDLEKALKDYKPIFDRPTPVRYDVLHFGDDHRRMDALLRRHYSSFHPLVRDIFTSFSLEFSLLLEKVEKMTEETESLREEVTKKKRELDEGLDTRIQELTNEKNILEDQIKEKDQKIENLENRVEELEKIMKEKDAVIVTQRRQLDLYIENEHVIQKEKKDQTETLYQSIEHVNKFTTELETIEAQMKELEAEKYQLLQENESLKSQITKTEDEYLSEIEEITELYNNLKQEFLHISDTISKLEEDKIKLQEQLSQEQSKENIDELVKQNSILQEEIEKLTRELEEKNSRIQELEEKQAKFKEVAAKLLQFKDQIEEQYHETKEYQQNKLENKSNQSSTEKLQKEHGQIIHPADKIAKKKRWKPKKSQLELEIEGKIDRVEEKRSSEYGDNPVVETEVNLDASVSRIQSALDGKSSTSELLKAIKQSTEDDDIDEQITNRLMSELLEREDLEGMTESEILQDSQNLQKVLARLEGKDLNLLDRFAVDFPMPPKEELVKKEKRVSSKEDQNNGSKNSLSA